MKKLISSLLAACMCLGVFINLGSLSINAQELYWPTLKNEFTETKKVTNSFIDENGHNIIQYDNGVEVEYITQDEIIIRDKNNVLGADLNIGNQTRAVGWVVIGKAIFSAIGVCSSIQYVTGFDICRIALSYLASPPPNSTYTVSAYQHAEHIPGCYPSSMPECIRYWYEYKLTRVS